MKRRDFVAAALPLSAGVLLPLTGCSSGREITGGFTGVSVERGHRLRDDTIGGNTRTTTATNTKTGTPPKPAKVHTTRVLIAGGGVAGLAAARALRLQGMQDFSLLELEDSAGGNARGGNVGGIVCPLGAHYLPAPDEAAANRNPGAQAALDLLEELGLRQRVAGRWQFDERHLCHSPQERLFFNGAWQDGLLPVQGVGADTLAQYDLASAQFQADLQESLRAEVDAYFQMADAKALEPIAAKIAAAL
jgi:glycine/D-amino acid oxidase-like deaminating enzyme